MEALLLVIHEMSVESRVAILTARRDVSDRQRGGWVIRMIMQTIDRKYAIAKKATRERE